MCWNKCSENKKNSDTCLYVLLFAFKTLPHYTVDIISCITLCYHDRKWSNERPGRSLNLSHFDGALIGEWRLLERGAYFKILKNRNSDFSYALNITAEFSTLVNTFKCSEQNDKVLFKD